MNLKSLRFRLLAGGAVAVAVALVAAWFFLTLLFEHHLERRLADELQRDGVRLVSGLTVGPGDSLAVAEGPRDERFTAPASGPYWQASSAHTTLRSPSLLAQALPTSLAAADAGASVPGEETRRVRKGGRRSG